MLPLRVYVGPVWCSGGVLFVGFLGGHCADGVWRWAYGYRSCVWGFPKIGLSAWDWSLSRPSLLGVYTPTKICWGRCLGDGVFWDSGFFFGSLVVWVWVFLCGGFMQVWCLQAFFCVYSLVWWLLGHFAGGAFPLYCIGFFLGLHGFVRGVHVGFVCYAGILISLLSPF